MFEHFVVESGIVRFSDGMVMKVCNDVWLVTHQEKHS